MQFDAGTSKPNSRANSKLHHTTRPGILTAATSASHSGPNTLSNFDAPTLPNIGRLQSTPNRLAVRAALAFCRRSHSAAACPVASATEFSATPKDARRMLLLAVMDTTYRTRLQQAIIKFGAISDRAMQLAPADVAAQVPILGF